MLSSLLKATLPSILVLLLCAALAPDARAQGYGDDFESPSFNPFWNISRNNGSVSVSTDLPHGGSRSAKFDSAFGGQREMRLYHEFASPAKGSFSLYFYDAAPGQETLYESLTLTNSVTGDLASVGTQDFDAYCYTASVYNYNTGIQQGPNAPCGIYPQLSTTNVTRTLGWHKLEINAAASGLTISIDSAQVFGITGDYSFDRIDISVTGPFWRPNTTAYFDDFNLVPLNDCAQQLQSLQSQLDALAAQNAQLQTQNAQLQTQNGQLQSQVGQLQGQVSQLQGQVSQLQGAIGGTLGGIQSNFRGEFRDPSFTIPGPTAFDQMQTLLNAVLNLNHGRKQGLYENLGGKR